MISARLPVILLAVILTAPGCARHPVPTSDTVGPTSAPAGHAPSTAGPAAAGISKVLIIAEENHGYDQVIGSLAAPYLNELATTYGSATRFDAGYPAGCPSLTAYILLTSGSTAGICDDRAPKAHQLHDDNVFRQVSAAGLQWRNYAQSAPVACALQDSNDGRYLVRHVPATYYLDERQDCERWAVPMGSSSSGALHDDVAAGTLPAFGFVSPDACHDMHGATPCPDDRVGAADRWLKDRLPAFLAGPDYHAGRLAIIITWDEGTSTDNHIPTLVIAPSTRHLVVDQPFTHCSTLRTVEELLRLPLLGCAATAATLRTAFRL
jgi:phospholipase C